MRLLKVMGMTFHREDALNNVRAQVWPVIEHLLYVKLFPANPAVNSWERTVTSCLARVSRETRLKKGKRLDKERTLQMFYDVVEDSNDVSGVLAEIAVKFDLNAKEWKPNISSTQIKSALKNLIDLIYSDPAITPQDVRRVLSDFWTL